MIHSREFRRTRCSTLLRHLLPALLATLFVASPAFAQEIDREPPSIAFEPLGEGRRGDTQVFSARVEDEGSGVDQVRLHFRSAGDDAYTAREMTPLAGTDIYTVSLDDIDPAVSSIEFYIDALDEVGNRSIEGFAFDPLERVLVDRGTVPQVDADASGETAPIGSDGLSTRRKILYGVLGVVALGALAAATGGGGGGGGGRVDTAVPVTILADPL